MASQHCANCTGTLSFPLVQVNSVQFMCCEQAFRVSGPVMSCQGRYGEADDGLAVSFMRRLRANTALSVATGNESAPMQLAQCWFPGLAVSNAKNINVLFQTALGNCSGLKLAKCCKCQLIWRFVVYGYSRLRRRMAMVTIIIIVFITSTGSKDSKKHTQ